MMKMRNMQSALRKQNFLLVFISLFSWPAFVFAATQSLNGTWNCASAVNANKAVVP